MSVVQRVDELLESYWGSGGAGVLPVALDSGRLLVALRSSRVKEPGTWGVFGGALDGESPEKTALRELREEAGYVGSITLARAHVFKDGDFTYHNFLGLVPIEFEPRLNWESDRAQWLTLEELLALPKKHFGLKALLKHSISKIERMTHV